MYTTKTGTTMKTGFVVPYISNLSKLTNLESCYYVDINNVFQHIKSLVHIFSYMSVKHQNEKLKAQARVDFSCMHDLSLLNRSDGCKFAPSLNSVKC